MSDNDTSAWGGLTPAQANKARPMPSIAECAEQDRLITEAEDRQGPIAILNARAALRNLRQLLTAEMVERKHSLLLEFADDEPQEAVIYGIATAIALLIDGGACWDDLMNSVEHTLAWRYDGYGTELDARSQAFWAHLPEQLRSALY